jgi:hypothetical protein
MWGMSSSEIWRRVGLVKSYFSEARITSIMRVEKSAFQRNTLAVANKLLFFVFLILGWQGIDLSRAISYGI